MECFPIDSRFTYFHEMVVQEERCRTMCPGYEDGLDGAVSIGLPVLLTLGADAAAERTRRKREQGRDWFRV